MGSALRLIDRIVRHFDQELCLKWALYNGLRIERNFWYLLTKSPGTPCETCAEIRSGMQVHGGGFRVLMAFSGWYPLDETAFVGVNMSIHDSPIFFAESTDIPFIDRKIQRKRWKLEYKST